MNAYKVILKHTTVVTNEIYLVADSKEKALAKAQVGGIDRVKEKEGVYRIETFSSETENSTIIEQIEYEDLTDNCCSLCGCPYDKYDGCFYCT